MSDDRWSAAIQQLWDAWDDPITLPEACMYLRMAVSGSADPMQDDLLSKRVAALRAKLAAWQPSTRPYDARFDAAVRELTQATLDEVTFYTKTLPDAGFHRENLPDPIKGPLGAVGQAHLTWQDKNFGEINLLTQALVLAEECGEVARVVVKTHHGIREHDRGDLADELADVILVATSLAIRVGIDIDAAVAAKAARRDLKDFRARPETG